MTKRGNRYAVAVEYVSKYVVLVPVMNHTAEILATALMTEVVFRFGPFRELITHGAPEFTGHLMEDFMHLLQAHQNITVPYRPNLAGQVERLLRT